jgi:hypothetical protein
VRITGDDGVTVELEPLRWQFPADSGEPDDEWLVVGGRIDAGGESWSFTDPCLLMTDARNLADWLLAASQGRIDLAPRGEDGQPEPDLVFLEPALGFAVVAYQEQGLLVRVYFTAEAAPPWLRADDPHGARSVVDLHLSGDQLAAAAREWAGQVSALPGRPWVEPATTVPELLSLAVSLIPENARSGAGLGPDDAGEYLGQHGEWEVALGILTDFDGTDWETAEYWAFLLAAADRMGLAGAPDWCRWRASETRDGIIRADLRLTSPEHGGRRTAVPGHGLFCTDWTLPPGTGNDSPVHAASVWIESMPELLPGGSASVRFAPLSPEDWRHLRVDDVITMNEGSTLTGTATVTQVLPQQHSPGPAARPAPWQAEGRPT